MKLLASGLVAVLAFGVSGCMDSDDVGESYRTFEGEMIGTFISGRQELGEFEKALRIAGAYELLESYGKYTCFIPNDEAMQAWYATTGTTLENMDTAAVREKLAAEIKAKALSWSIAHASVEEIDALNILEATMLAMKAAEGKACRYCSMKVTRVQERGTEKSWDLTAEEIKASGPLDVARLYFRNRYGKELDSGMADMLSEVIGEVQRNMKED